MNIKIASPCQESWGDMQGDEKVRFCNRCSLNVYNLSSMSPEEASTVMTGSGGRACVRFFQRRDGTVLTKDCPVGRRKRWTVIFSAAGILAGLLSVIAGVMASSRESTVRAPRPKWLVTVMEWLGHREPEPMPLMGKPCPPPPPPSPAPTPSPTEG